MVWVRSKIVEKKISSYFLAGEFTPLLCTGYHNKEGCFYLGSPGELTRYLAAILKIFGHTKPGFAINI